MSEGEHHVRLVASLLEAMLNEFEGSVTRTFCDHPQDGRFPRPGLIGSTRPDIHLQRDRSPWTVIGEAKTARDVDNLHTRAQLREFFEHLSTESEGLLWLAVPLQMSGAAFRISKEVRREVRAERVRFCISGWLLGLENLERRWYG